MPHFGEPVPKKLVMGTATRTTNFSSAAAGATDVPGLSVTIELLSPANVLVFAKANYITIDAVDQANELQIARDGVAIASTATGMTDSTGVEYPAIVQTLDMNVPAGIHTYKVMMRSYGGATTKLGMYAGAGKGEISCIAFPV